MAADTTFNAKIQGRSNGDLLAVASGGTLEIESGGIVSMNGVDRTAALSTAPAAVAAGYKIARGEAVLDGSNPTPITTGLTTCIAAIACLKGSAAPGDNTSVLTTVIGTADFDVYAWKNTGGTDPTLVASTGTEGFYWIAIGT
jgi:hypothetical protein